MATQAEAVTTAPGTPWTAVCGALSEAIDGHFSALDRRWHPGAIVAALHHGKVVHLRGYGCANAEFDIPWSPDTLYTFFSLTKPMVATACLRLADAGRLSLDAALQEFLPDFPRFEHDITVRHLLTHTSGLWQDEALIQLIGASAGDDPLSLDELYALAKRQPALPFRPGSHFYYNDTGMRLAARVIEAASGRSFADAMGELVFQPAGMTSAVVQRVEPSRRRGQAGAYIVSSAGPPGAMPVSGTVAESSGDGGTAGSILDLIAFARFVTSKARGESYLDRLARPVEYGPGFAGAYRTCVYELRHRGLRIVQHSGVHGKRAAYLPEHDYWVIVMRNALIDGRDDWFEDVAVAIDAAVECGLLTLSPAAAAAFIVEPRYPSAPNQEWTADEYRTLCGRFLEPDSGLPLTIERTGNAVSFSLLGERGLLTRVSAATYRTYIGSGAPPLELSRSAGELTMRHADWPFARLLRRVTGEAGRPLDAVAGRYQADALGATYHIQRIDGQLRLCVGPGVRRSDHYRLMPVADEVFEGVPEAGGADQVAGFAIRFCGDDRAVLSSDNVRGIELRRVG